MPLVVTVPALNNLITGSGQFVAGNAFTASTYGYGGTFSPGRSYFFNFGTNLTLTGAFVGGNVLEAASSELEGIYYFSAEGHFTQDQMISFDTGLSGIGPFAGPDAFYYDGSHSTYTVWRWTAPFNSANRYQAGVTYTISWTLQP